MLYKFKSKAAGDLIMLEPNGRRVLQIIGKEPGPKGIVLPEEGYSEGVREITRKHDVLLVIDETHTLCAGPGGATRAWGLEPDLLVEQ